MIHGARAVVARAKYKDDRLSRWVTNIAKQETSECGSGGISQQDCTHGLGYAAGMKQITILTMR